MLIRSLLFTTSAIVMAGQLLGQQQPIYSQMLNCVKVLPGKSGEYRQFVAETSKKVAEVRLEEGEIISWTFLRSVLPQGSEARCDYMISTMFEGAPRAAGTREDMNRRLQKAGVKMDAADFVAKRDSLSQLVSTELWRPRIRVGAPQKGHYMYVNYMKVHDLPEYNEFENTIWRPMAEVWVKEGLQSGWVFSNKMLPGGSETPYVAYSADIFPSWDAVFTSRPLQQMFEKTHPGRNFQQTFSRLDKLRDLARRELHVVEERVAKQ